MTNAPTSSRSSKDNISACLSITLLVLSIDVVQAYAQWPWPWPDSSHLPAGATQYGNAFPDGNLWAAGTLYTPVHPPQRYLSWTFEYAHGGLPDIYGALDPAMATYHDKNNTLVVGCDMYNLDGLPIAQTNSLPINASDPRWNPFRNGYAGGLETLAADLPGADTAYSILRDTMILFHIANTGSDDPNGVTHAWLSFNFLGNYFDSDYMDDSVPPATVSFGPNCVIDGTYYAPAETPIGRWGYYGFAVTLTNNVESETFAIANTSIGDIWLDTLQIATDTVPEPGTWGLVALGGLGLIIRRRRQGHSKRF